jgi:hypothetical protein
MAQPIWNTPAGSLGTYPFGILSEYTLSAQAVLPAVSLEYILLSGSLPPGLSLSIEGVISGIPTLVTTETISTFAVRVTDNYGSIRDRTFSITITGSALPSFTTPPGILLTVNDSVWVELPIEYSNPDSSNTVEINLLEGTLPPGLEINNQGIIRGYAAAPTVNVSVPTITTAATLTETTNIITCLSTTGFTLGRPVIFTGTVVFGDISAGYVYYIKSILSSTTFTISFTPNGTTVTLSSGTGFMTVTCPAINVGQPTIRTYNFSLQLDSPIGSDINNYSITVVNQNTPTSQGGPGKPVNTREPVILNTRPESYNVTTNIYYGYYVLPSETAEYNTYPITVPAFIGTFQSNDYFSFKIIGKDFDNNDLTYVFSGLPLGLTGDSLTGWVTGTPILTSAGINQYGFSVAVYKTLSTSIQSPFYNFSFNVSNNIDATVIWITPDYLGVIPNGTISIKSVIAECQVDLNYRITSGSLPPNLTLLSNGEITGYVANQPSTVLLNQNDTTDYTFEIEAYSPEFPIIKNTKTFTITVLQKYKQPTDILYIKATPSLGDREILNTLLTNTTIIPTEYLYRPNDVYFGKASDVIYEHAYGIYASDIDEYIAAVTRNHYWRNITLGEIKTAQAKDSNGNIIYEVVYSQVIDNLQNPKGVSVSEGIYWPRPINLFLGPWYTSATDIFTSYVDINEQLYYTSLTPGFARNLYPNSLFNMRNRVGQVLGQEFDSTLLPAWMTSQQENGSTLGYTQAWVICYTKPGYATIVKNNIETMWIQPDGYAYSLNMINFKIDRFSVDKQITYNYDKNVSPPAWTGLPSATPVPDPLDSKDFYVLFPRQTILPNETQY